MGQELIDFAASSGTGHCILQRPGHTVNIVQARRSGMEAAVAVRPKVEADWGTVHFIAHGEARLMWNHEAQRLATALADSGGAALWRPRNRCLAVPRAGEDGQRGYALFSLTALDLAGLCRRETAA